MKEKAMAIMIAVAMILSLAACGNSNQEAAESSEVQEQISSSETQARIQSSGAENSADSREEEILNEEDENDTGEAGAEQANDDASKSAGSSQAAEIVGVAASTEQQAAAGSNILIVYFSRHGSSVDDTDVDAVTSASLSPGNTIIAANMIQRATGADTFQIVTVNPYPKDYRETTDVAAIEKDNNERPDLSARVENIDAYDTIILGYPNWWGTIPMPVATFLDEYNLSGKTILPYCMHEGSGLGSSVSDITALCPDSTVLSGLSISTRRVESANEDIINWLSGHGII